MDESFSGLLQFARRGRWRRAQQLPRPYRTWLEVAGTEGVLAVANPFKPGPSEVIEIHRGEEERRETVEGSPLLFVRQIEDFVAAALDGRAPAVSLRESRGNAAALAALHESARSRRAVTI